MIWGHIAFTDVVSAAFTKSDSEIVKVDLQPTERRPTAAISAICCTWVDPRSVDQRAKHVVAVVEAFFFFLFYSYDGKQHMICRRGGKSLYVLIVQYVMSDATGLFIKTELRFYGMLSREIGVNQQEESSDIYTSGIK